MTLEKVDARRIADAIQAYRPDWSTAQLMAVLGDERIRLRRQPVDVAVALTALAFDPATRQPTRLFEHGPWWEAARPLAPVVQLYRRPTGLDCVTCHLPEADCRSRDGGHEFDPRPQPPAPMPDGLLSNQPEEGA